jgi:prepilin-type N-terminal cleavage/methylation domain-containing protein
LNTRSGGFSLIEVIVAVSVVTLVVIPAMAVVAQDIRTLQRIDRRLQAEALISSIDPTDDTPKEETWTVFPPPFSAYEYRLAVSADSIQQQMSIVTATVRWSGGSVSRNEVRRQ